MSDFNYTNNFANNTTADADEVDQNFEDVKEYVTTELIMRDGSIAMTDPLTLEAADPTQNGHAVRRKYLTDRLPSFQQSITAVDLTGITTGSGEQTVNTVSFTTPEVDGIMLLTARIYGTWLISGGLSLPCSFFGSLRAQGTQLANGQINRIGSGSDESHTLVLSAVYEYVPSTITAITSVILVVGAGTMAFERSDVTFSRVEAIVLPNAT